MKNFIKKTKLILFYSIKSVLLTSILAGLFGLFRGNIIKIVFYANYIVGSILIAVGLFSFFIPISLRKLAKPKELIDHSNIIDVLREERQVKISESMINISWGLFHILLIGIIEILIKFIY